MAEKKKKTPSYKKGFVVNKNRTIRAGMQFSKCEGKYKSRTHFLIGQMCRLAMKHTGYNSAQMAFYLRMGKAETTIKKRIPQVLRKGETTRIRYDRYLALASMARIPIPIAVVLYCQSFIPKEYEHHKKYVGLASKRWPKSSQFGQDTPEENKDVSQAIHEEVQHNAKMVPELKKIRSGIMLEPPKNIF